MTPVISPWVFYLMPLCEEIKFLASLLGAIGLIASLVIIASQMYNATSEFGDEKVAKALIPVRKIVVPVTIVTIILSIFIPSESTITKMLIAQNVTHERVEVATDIVQSVYEDITDLFEEDD